MAKLPRKYMNIPQPLHAQIKDAAERNKRTMIAELFQRFSPDVTKLIKTYL